VILLLSIGAFVGGGAIAQSLEGALSPGRVIAAHAKWEDDCAKCHVRFDKAAQDRLCLDCHKPIGADVAAKRGFHGRLEPAACRSCHTDHKGRDVRVAAFDERKFDHAKTDFALVGAHVRVECRACHTAGRPYRLTPLLCDDCHRKDDKHKGSLGPLCADCHTQSSWKDARFDHSKTRFALTGKHVEAKCASCHTTPGVYKDAPQACVGCHRKDDKQHRGRLGDRCESCHNAKDWKDTASFQHDRDTQYPLRGKHRGAKCESCHTTPMASLARDKLPTDCIGCHRKDDKHAGTLGNACADCHVERSWRETRVDHDKTRFRLLGKHRDVECKDCHRDPKSFKGAPLDCFSCHRKDDKHKGVFGEACEKCHVANGWPLITFRHDRDTKYALRGRHGRVACASCHTVDAYRHKTDSACNACHAKDDKHKDELGARCETCHTESSWKVERFDHNRARFVLVGRHAAVDCAKCHKSAAFRDAPRTCVGCHDADDRHKRTLGADCAACHNARDWRIWDFDHAIRARYPLDGAHGKLACVACHRVPGDKVPALASECVACHRKDDVHDANYGMVCERCHTTQAWRALKLDAMRRLPAGDNGRRP
jgi:hypothetical protein